MKHIVYFEIYGKKMKTVVDADSAQEAKETIKDKIIFHKLEAQPEEDPYDFADELRAMFSMNG